MLLPQFYKDLSSPTPLKEEQIGPPLQIAYYSCFPRSRTKYRYEYQSRKALKVYSPPKFGKSASRLITTAIEESMWRKDSERLDLLGQPGLVPIIDSCLKAGRTKELFAAHVVTTRGTLVDLAVGKVEKYDLLFTKGILYILRSTFESRARKSDNRGRLAKYYGDCFERLCTKEVEEPDGEFFSIVSREICGLKVIMSAEVDCSSSRDTVPNIEDYIELKTVKEPKQLRPDLIGALFRRWYIQSYLPGIQTLQIGYRDSENHVADPDRRSIQEFLDDAKEYDQSFDPAFDMGRLHTILKALLDYFEGLESDATIGHRSVLYINANGVARILKTRRV